MAASVLNLLRAAELKRRRIQHPLLGLPVDAEARR
jgi:hypothetical protein